MARPQETKHQTTYGTVAHGSESTPLDQDQRNAVTKTINRISNRMHTAMRRPRFVRFSRLHLHLLHHEQGRYTIRIMFQD